jgi:methionyl aminopeptidase
MIKLKTEEEIEKLKIGGQKLAKILQELKKDVVPGASSYDLNKKGELLMHDEGGKPSFLGYTPTGASRPYPGAICVSINDEIVHGIPNEQEKIIKEGDIVTLDAGLIYDGLYTDHAITIIVGEVSKEIRELVSRTEEALYAGIKQARVGNRIGDIGAAILKVAESANLSVVESLTGHGVGYGVHEDPYVPNYGRSGEGDLIEEGLVIAIEPMFSLGSDEIKVASDGYTYLTEDGSLSAQFEHTVAITKDGPVILTKI